MCCSFNVQCPGLDYDTFMPILREIWGEPYQDLPQYRAAHWINPQRHLNYPTPSFPHLNRLCWGAVTGKGRDA